MTSSNDRRKAGLLQRFSVWCRLCAVLVAILGLIAGDRASDGQAGSAVVAPNQPLPLRAGLMPNDRATANIEGASIGQVIAMYGEITGRTTARDGWKESLNDFSIGRLSRWRIISLPARPLAGISFHRDGRWRVDELKETLETILRTNRVLLVPRGQNHFQVTLQTAPPPPAQPR